MSGEARNLFISHAHRDGAELQEVKNLLGKNGYAFRESPVDGIQPHINWANVLVVMISPGTHTRPQVDREIQTAQQQSMRIVGVYVQGGTVSDLPANFQLYADALVDCQANRVVDAIEGRIDTLFMPDGETEFPERDIDRFVCGEAAPE